MSTHKFYCTIYNVEGTPTSLGFYESALNALSIGHFTETEFEQFVDDLATLADVVESKVISRDTEYEEIFVPEVDRTISVEVTTIVTKPEYTDFYSFVASLPEVWKVGPEEYPNSWPSKLYRSPNRVHTVGWHGHVQINGPVYSASAGSEPATY